MNDFNSDLIDANTAGIHMGHTDLIIYQCRIYSNSNYVFSHQHKCYELYYMIEGSMKLIIEDKCYSLIKGDVCLIGPDTSHKSWYTPALEQDYLLITFDFTEADNHNACTYDLSLETEISCFLRLMRSRKYWIRKDTRGCLDIFESICEELASYGIGSYLKIQSLIYILITSAFQNLDSHYSRRTVCRYPSRNKAIQITDYIYAHFNEPISLQTVAQALNISVRHVNRLLKEYFGTTFGEVISVLRLNKAKYLLCKTDYSQDRIAEMVGFAYVSTLQALFKKNEGMTVSRYRLYSREEEKRIQYNPSSLASHEDRYGIKVRKPAGIAADKNSEQFSEVL